MYAIDFSCKSTDVLSPAYFDRYVIRHVWYDERLWDYIVIANGEYSFLYGHTNSELKVWDRIGKRQKIWVNNLSWITTWRHVHMEVWLRKSNIKFDKLYGWDIISAPKSKDLLIQRWLYSQADINKEILSYISQFEWMHLEAYWDVRQYSIWYGTPSYKGEKISREEAEKRARKRIDHIRGLYGIRNLPINKQKAIVSYVYNIGSLSPSQKAFLRNKNFSALANDIIKYNKMRVDWVLVVAWWLEKRRKSEYNLFFNY